MNGRQLLVLGSLILLANIVISCSDTYNNEVTASNMNETALIGSGIAESILDEVQLRAFDENTIGGAVDAAVELTSPASLGPDLESSSNFFDDIDDYDNYIHTIVTDDLGDFGIAVDVYYIQAELPGIESTTRTFTKQVDVTITNPDIEGGLTMSTIVSYLKNKNLGKI